MYIVHREPRSVIGLFALLRKPLLYAPQIVGEEGGDGDAIMRFYPQSWDFAWGSGWWYVYVYLFFPSSKNERR